MTPEMGWCHEFGPQIAERCEHPMTAHADRCECTECGTVCKGRFAGCGAVWARGPREVSVGAPHRPSADPFDKWRLPVESSIPPIAPVYQAVPAPTSSLFPEANDDFTPVLGSEPEQANAIEGEGDEPHDEQIPPDGVLESPDVTTRFAVAQLEQLNERISALTDESAVKTAVALDKVYGELRRLSSQREVDLTEQASGIFAAVQIGADALVAFSETVTEVTADLRVVLEDALKAIGGTDGLAAWIAASAAEVHDTREEFAASLGKIERDLSLIRRRSNAEVKPAKLDDDQVHLIVDAVTDSVLAALENLPRKRR